MVINSERQSVVSVALLKRKFLITCLLVKTPTRGKSVESYSSTGAKKLAT